MSDTIARFNVYDENSDRILSLSNGLPKILGRITFNAVKEYDIASKLPIQGSSLGVTHYTGVIHKELKDLPYSCFFSFLLVYDAGDTYTFNSVPNLFFNTNTGELNFTFNIDSKNPYNISEVTYIYGVF